MNNKLIDLNNHLFAQLERLGEEELNGDALKDEIDRSRAISGIASNIVENARLALEAHKAMGNTIRTMPQMIGEQP